MSVARYGDRYVPTCDYCGHELPPEWGWHDAVEAMRRAWWKNVNEGRQWSNYCPGCYRAPTGAASDFEGVGP